MNYIFDVDNTLIFHSTNTTGRNWDTCPLEDTNKVAWFYDPALVRIIQTIPTSWITILTGRHQRWLDFTRQQLNDFNIPYARLFHERTDETPNAYKQTIIAKHFANESFFLFDDDTFPIVTHRPYNSILFHPSNV